MMIIAKRKLMENVLQKREKLPLLVNMRNALLRGMGNILTNVKRHIKNVLNIRIKQNAIVLLK